MARKKWEARTEITPDLLKFREKRKWQITLRRYVIEKSPCPQYAPYFGLDIQNLRKWFEYQFIAGQSWENFGKTWQFDHIIPVTYFNHAKEEDLRLCWNFTNLRVGPLNENKKRGAPITLLGARAYFDDLYTKTGYPIAKALHYKIISIERSESIPTDSRQKFLVVMKDYIVAIENYSALEYELLNHGRTPEEVKRELGLLKKNNPR